jgi:hypothetical protein
LLRAELLLHLLALAAKVRRFAFHSLDVAFGDLVRRSVRAKLGEAKQRSRKSERDEKHRH